MKEMLNLKALEQFGKIDLQALLTILMYDVHPCGIDGPFYRWQRI